MLWAREVAGALNEWIDQRAEGSARSLKRAVSATGLTRRREVFGWTVRPAPGSVLASPRAAAWDPEPDYFHHWARDAATVMRLAPLLARRAEDGAWWVKAFRDHVAFSLKITDPRSPPLAANPLRGTKAI